MTLTFCILLGRINRQAFPPLTVSPHDNFLPSFCNIHAKPYDQTGSGAKGKEEREPFPVVPRAINNGLNDVRADHTGSSIRETEQAEELEGYAPVILMGSTVCGTYSPCCRNREDSVQPSSSGRKHSRELGTVRIRRYMPYITAEVRRLIHCRRDQPTYQNSQAL